MHMTKEKVVARLSLLTAKELDSFVEMIGADGMTDEEIADSLLEWGWYNDDAISAIRKLFDED